MNPNAEKIQNSNPKHLVWDFLIFEHLDLFRISDFEFRASAFFRGILVGVFALAVAFALYGAGPTRSRQRKIFRIGFLDNTTASGIAVRLQAFWQEVRKLGWIEGKNITIEYRFAEGKAERLT